MNTPQLAQRGRAAISFQAGIGRAASRLMAQAEAELAEHGVTAQTLPEDMDMRHATIEAAIGDSAAFKLQQLLSEWRAKAHGPTARQAFEDIRSQVEPELQALDAGPSTLDADPAFVPPAYWSDTEFHRTTGGWDANEHNGYIHGELLHKLMLAKMFPGDIFAQRRAVAQTAPRRDYRDILDMGASSGHYTVALADTFPTAQITGIDLSMRMLQHAKRTGNARQAAWQLHVRPAEATGFEDGSFDLVTSFNLLHELPPPVIDAVFAEAFRVLRPGGDMVMSDVPRFSELDRLTAWRFDLVAKWGGEPFWRASASMDLAAAARRAGFTDIDARGIGAAPTRHPYVIYGRKPAE